MSEKLTLADKLTLAGVNAIAAFARNSKLPFLREKKELADKHLVRLQTEPTWKPTTEQVADVAMVYGTSSSEFAAMDRRTGGAGRL